MIRVLIADDQDLVRAGIRALLANDPEIAVVAEASDGGTAADRAREHRPDVVMMDLRMPRTNGIEATRRIRADPALDRTRILVLTTFDDDDDIVEAIRVGAAGYLLKDTPSDDLRAAVHTVAGGGSMLSPNVAKRLIEHVAALPRPAVPHPRLDDLTERELAVLRHIAHGENNAELALSLYISPATARTYVSRILTKLDARDRTELAVIAHRSGLYDDGGRPSP